MEVFFITDIRELIKRGANYLRFRFDIHLFSSVELDIYLEDEKKSLFILQFYTLILVS